MGLLYECGRVVDGDVTVEHLLIDPIKPEAILNVHKYAWSHQNPEEFKDSVKSKCVYLYGMTNNEPTLNTQGRKVLEFLMNIPKLCDINSLNLYVDNYVDYLPKFNINHFSRALVNPKLIACSINHVTMYMGKPFISITCFNEQLSEFISYMYDKFNDVSANINWNGHNTAELVLPLPMIYNSEFVRGEYKLLISEESLASLKALEGDARKLWLSPNDTAVGNEVLASIHLTVFDINNVNMSVEYPTEYKNINTYFDECGFNDRESQDAELTRLYKMFKVDSLTELDNEIVVLLSHE